MAPLFKLKGKGKTKPLDDIEEEDEVRTSKFLKTSTKTTSETKKDVLSNRHVSTGKIHVEVLYRIFDQYRIRMSQANYGAGDPFLLERRVATMRSELKDELTKIGFDEFIDFSFIPMPPVVTSGIYQDKETRELLKVGEKPSKAKGAKNKKPPVDEDDEDE
jgi:hypothetical protein